MSDLKRVKQPVIEGAVLDTRYRKDAKQLEHLLAYTDAQGESCQRWFLDSQLEDVTKEPVVGEQLPEGNGEGA